MLWDRECKKGYRVVKPWKECFQGFVGHMAEPEEATKQAVLVISGGEKSIFSGIKIAERQADIRIEVSIHIEKIV